jgi:hypothetical protein
MKHTQADVDRAIRQVKEVEARVVEQRARIERLRVEGQTTAAAEKLLASLQESLALMMVHLGTEPDEGGILLDQGR